MIFSHRAYGETRARSAFVGTTSCGGAKLLLLPTLAAILIVHRAVSRDNFRPRDPWRWRFLLLPVWALFQQYVLQGYLNRRAQIVFGPGWKSVVLVGLLFARRASAEPAVVLLTFLGGTYLGENLSRAAKPFAFALSHALASISGGAFHPTTVDQ